MPGSPMAVYTQQDFQLIPLLNLVAEPVSGSVAASPTNVGRFYRNTATGRFEYVKNATTVVSLPESGGITDADIAAGAAIAISKLATNPLLRSNHTGTQLAATISDLAATVQAYRLDQFAVPTGNLNLNGQRVTQVADAVANTDVTTLQQVNNLISAIVNGHDWKDSVRVAVGTDTSLTSPGATLDGVALTAGDRVLLTGQASASQNGIYVFNGATSALTRAADADASNEVTSGMTVPVTGGTKQSQLAILTTPDPLTLGTTALAFTFLSNATAYTAGTGITITGNTISLTSPVTIGTGGTGATTAPAARANLNVPQRGFATDLGPMNSGVGLDVTHGLGTLDVAVQVYRKTDGATVQIAANRKDVNTVTVTPDVTVGTGVLRLVVTPVL